jgi:hypothetical protein
VAVQAVDPWATKGDPGPEPVSVAGSGVRAVAGARAAFRALSGACAASGFAGCALGRTEADASASATAPTPMRSVAARRSGRSHRTIRGRASYPVLGGAVAADVVTDVGVTTVTVA